MRLACSQPHTNPFPWWQLHGRLGGGKAAATETILYLNNTTPLMWTDGEVRWAAGLTAALKSTGEAQEGMRSCWVGHAERGGRHANACQLSGQATWGLWTTPIHTPRNLPAGVCVRLPNQA